MDEIIRQELEKLRLDEKTTETRLQERFETIKTIIVVSWTFLTVMIGLVLFAINQINNDVKTNFEAVRNRLNILESKK